MALTAALTLFTLAVHGYHPYAEDGGLYLAGAKYVLNPTLYPNGTEFVTAHLSYSLFAPLVALSAAVCGGAFDLVALCLYVGSVWLTLLAAWMLAQTLFESQSERTGALLLLASWMSLPIAGTSLMLADPYLTARSFSTPLILFAFAFAVRRRPGRSAAPDRWLGCSVLSLLLAAAFHPLMAAYGGVLLLAFYFVRTSREGRRSWGRVAVLLCLIFLLAAGAQWALAPESLASRTAALSRDYWFLAQWRWFEIAGLAGPLLVLAALGRGASKALRDLTKVVLVVSLFFVLLALCFARQELHSFAVARLQPLRIFQLTYIVMTLALGGRFGALLRGRGTWTWALATVAFAAPLYCVERAVYPLTPHLEYGEVLRANRPANGWVEAFLWVRHNTPVNAVFALDSDYISKPGEDAQSFRAIAERSSLPDLSKDGGEAAITPRLAPAWEVGIAAQRELSRESDATRFAMLRPLGVTWIVLEHSATTSLRCPHDNAVVKVCRLEAGS